MFSALRDLFAFLLAQGVASIAWVGGLGAVGVFAGVFLAFGAGFVLRRSALASRRRFSVGVVVVYTFVALPLSLALVGSLLGSAYAVRDLTENPVLVRRAVALSFEGTEAAVRSIELPEEQRDLVLDVVGGEETFAVDEIDGVLDQLSDETLAKILEVYDTAWSPQDQMLGIAARELGRRLVAALIEGRTDRGRDIVAPAIEELRLESGETGRVTGLQIGVALVHHGVQRPLARWGFWAVLSQAFVLVPVLSVLLLGPLALLWLYDRIRPAPEVA